MVTPDTDWFSDPPNTVKLHILEWPFIVAKKVVRYGSLFWYHSQLLTMETDIIAYRTGSNRTAQWKRAKSVRNRLLASMRARQDFLILAANQMRFSLTLDLLLSDWFNKHFRWQNTSLSSFGSASFSICALLVLINHQYVNNRHANKQLVNSENWSLY